jgi:hypothetical protein
MQMYASTAWKALQMKNLAPVNLVLGGTVVLLAKRRLDAADAPQWAYGLLYVAGLAVYCVMVDGIFDAQLLELEIERDELLSRILTDHELRLERGERVLSDLGNTKSRVSAPLTPGPNGEPA